jgi:ABC-type lipoprotein export system ATPase subunit
MRRDASLHAAVEPQVLRIRNVGRRLGEKSVWIDSLDLPRGKVIVILGASGSGKSSLLHLLGGLAAPDYRQDRNSLGVPSKEPALEASFPRGDRYVAFDLCKRPATKEFQDRVGFVFQSAYLLQSASASANMALGAYSAGRSIEPGAVQQIAGALSIDPAFLDERTSARSGGERQRIAVARAFARAPNLILADEPTASLDPKLAEEIIGYLGEWSDPSGDRTTIWATHDVHLAARFSDFVIVLREGRLADWAKWPQVNPGDPWVLRRWIDGEASVGQRDDPVSQHGYPRPSRAVAEQALTGSVPTEPASSWARLLFWARIGIAQVFDGTKAAKVDLPRKSASLEAASTPAAAPVRVGDRKGAASIVRRFWESFGAKAAVARLALFVTLMIVLWAELNGLAWNIRNSLLSPTLNPVVISSRATIDDSAIAEAQRTLAIERQGTTELPDTYGRYEFGSRRIAILRDDVLTEARGEQCARPQSRRDKEVLMDVAGLDPAERVLERLPFASRPNMPPGQTRVHDRNDGLWSITMSREAERKLIAVLGASPKVRFVCLEIRGNWITAEVTGIFEEATRGRFAPYDVIMSASQWRDFGIARDRDYYQSAAVYFDADPARSRQLIDIVRTRAGELTDPPNTRLVQSLANEAAFERISGALERSLFSQIIVGFLGAVSFAILVLVLWGYISENFQSNLKSICVALAFGAGFGEIATVQITRSALVTAPTVVLAGLATLGFQQYQVQYSADPASKFVWSFSSAAERFGLAVVVFAAAVLLLTLVFSATWLTYIRRRSLTDQLKELD